MKASKLDILVYKDNICVCIHKITHRDAYILEREEEIFDFLLRILQVNKLLQVKAFDSWLIADKESNSSTNSNFTKHNVEPKASPQNNKKRARDIRSIPRSSTDNHFNNGSNLKKETGYIRQQLELQW